MGMVVQHNVSAMNANNAMTKNVAGLKKQTEKLSTGYSINRAADNAAGLAISEKMRSQIRGLSQATSNANDAISLIQTAEGGLQETEDIMQRMRELSVQSANGTYTDEDREQIQYEIDALKDEVDRISQSTEYNEMKLLDGSLDGKGPTNGDYGAKYGVINDGKMTEGDAAKIAANADYTKILDKIKTNEGAREALGISATATSQQVAQAIGDYVNKGNDTSDIVAAGVGSDPLSYTGVASTDQDVEKMVRAISKLAGNGASAGFDGSVLTSNVAGASITVSTNATKDGESASWDKDGKTLTLNLVKDKTYSQDDIDKLIKNADTKKADGVVADVSLKLKDGVYTAKNLDHTATTAAGVRADSKAISLLYTDPSVKTEEQEAFDEAKAAKATAAADVIGTKKTDWIDAIKAAIDEADDADSDDKVIVASTVSDVNDLLGSNLTATSTRGDLKDAIDTWAATLDTADKLEAAFKTANDFFKNTTVGKSTLAANNTAAKDLGEAIDTYAQSKVDYSKAADALDNQMKSANVLSAPTSGYGDQIKFTSNTYGVDDRKFKIATDVQAGKESVDATKEDTVGLKDGEYTIHLSTGVEYSKDDIEKLMAKAGLDYTVEISDSNKPDGDVKMKLDRAVSEEHASQNGMANGEGVGKDETTSTGDGLTFQIGANGVEDQRLTVNVGDMSSKALGINDISVATQDGANAAINKLDDAIKTVSTQRAKLGAVQNRLEHTVNSLNTANENMTSSESQIRDTDMASEMIKYTKSNILQQASQSMLAQANQQPQGVLQLLG